MSFDSSSSKHEPSVEKEMDERNKAPVPILAASTMDTEKQATVLVSGQDQWISGIRLWAIVTSVTLGCFVVLLDSSIVSTAIPKITSQFHSLQDIGWYGAAYQLAAATIQPVAGKMFQSFDTRWTYFSFLFVFELGSLLCGVATSSKMLIVARAVAGLGTSGLLSGALTVIAQCRPMRDRPALTGIVLGVAQLGVALGPTIGGVLTQFATWRWCFYINLPIGALIAVPLAFTRIPEQVVKPKPGAVLQDLHNKLDLVGFALFAPAIVMLLLAVQWGGNQYPWNSSIVIGLFCGGGVVSFIWLAWDYYKGDAAMIPLKVLHNRHVWSSYLILAFNGTCIYVTSFYLPVYFQGVRGRSPAISGVFLLASILPQVIGSIGAGRAVGKSGYYLPWAVAGAIPSTVGYGLLSTLSPSTSTGDWVGYQILVGAGRGTIMQMPLIAIQHTLVPSQIPTAMSLAMFSQNFGAALFLSFADTIFTNRLRSLMKHDAPSVDPQAVINAGAYGFRSVVPNGALPGVLNAYAKSIDSVWYMLIGLSGGCFVLAWMIGWVDIRKETSTSPKSDMK